MNGAAVSKNLKDDAYLELSHIETKPAIRLSDGLIVGKEYGYDGSGFSRRHCRFIVNGPHIFIQDLNSRHGTFINGLPLDAGVFYPLRVGDRLQVGCEGYIVRELDLEHTDTVTQELETFAPRRLASWDLPAATPTADSFALRWLEKAFAFIRKFSTQWK